MKRTNNSRSILSSVTLLAACGIAAGLVACAKPAPPPTAAYPAPSSTAAGSGGVIAPAPTTPIAPSTTTGTTTTAAPAADPVASSDPVSPAPPPAPAPITPPEPPKADPVIASSAPATPPVKKPASPPKPTTPVAEPKVTSAPASKPAAKPANKFQRPADIVLDRQALSVVSARGEALWGDKSLSSRGLACASCHQDGRLFKPSFASPYPHGVELVSKQTGLNKVDIDEMVNFCLQIPMKGEKMSWNSNDILALSAYALEQQRQYIEAQARKSMSN